MTGLSTMTDPYDVIDHYADRVSPDYQSKWPLYDRYGILGDMTYKSADWEPEQVVVIISPSRCGSTIFKYMLCLHPDICHLAGEEEPYLKLAGNGWPWHNSDAFDSVKQPELIRDLICSELSNIDNQGNRAILQRKKVEEPPYVNHIICRKTPTVVFKTPQNCYRPNLFETLYPDADVKYITMSRDEHAIVNGLMDGWKSGSKFTARLAYDRWWCFDMPPGWTWADCLVARCWKQYERASMATASFRQHEHHTGFHIHFDTRFLNDWLPTCLAIWRDLGLSPWYPSPGDLSLPVLMSTDNSGIDRWRDKRPWLEEALLP